ncbi:very short patch repair endonuclease [Mycobacterium sherrisii]|uniref:very short patch repair endonuclease n=1 Tax=Mycobacterium sherrisii TaxID=243061 RepID=UPI000A146C44|nr:very short patch repair endonuclease [Mycobacterium sherrisii]
MPEAAPAYPRASSLARSASMKGSKRADTMPERRLRSLLHQRGLRFRKDLRLDLPGGKVRPDVVFTRAKIAVFVDGCFWHACPDHSAPPRVNQWYWGPKLDRTRQRDAHNDEILAAAGWISIRVWEHEPPELVASRVEATYRARASTD